MPSFGLLAREDVEALASYTLHLSIRGEVEYWALFYALRQDPETLKAVEKDPAKESRTRAIRFLSVFSLYNVVDVLRTGSPRWSLLGLGAVAFGFTGLALVGVSRRDLRSS